MGAEMKWIVSGGVTFSFAAAGDAVGPVHCVLALVALACAHFASMEV
jgi:hypothetical protein